MFTYIHTGTVSTVYTVLNPVLYYCMYCTVLYCTVGAIAPWLPANGALCWHGAAIILCGVYTLDIQDPYTQYSTVPCACARAVHHIIQNSSVLRLEFSAGRSPPTAQAIRAIRFYRVARHHRYCVLPKCEQRSVRALVYHAPGTHAPPPSRRPAHGTRARARAYAFLLPSAVGSPPCPRCDAAEARKKKKPCASRK